MKKQLNNTYYDTLSNIYCKNCQALISYSCSICNNIEMSKDIVQNLFYKMLLKENILDIKNLKYYIFKAVKNNTLNELRKNNRRKQVLNKLTTEAIRTNSISTKSERDYDFLLEEILTKQINRLPIKRRTTFIMKRIQGESVKQISEKLSISKKTVENHITNARNQLKNNIGNRF